jgi:hypothetical protein
MPSGSDLAFWRLGRIFIQFLSRRKKTKKVDGTSSGYMAEMAFFWWLSRLDWTWKEEVWVRVKSILLVGAFSLLLPKVQFTPVQ